VKKRKYACRKKYTNYRRDANERRDEEWPVIRW
jgi:hypothetical protein